MVEEDVMNQGMLSLHVSTSAECRLVMLTKVAPHARLGHQFLGLVTRQLIQDVMNMGPQLWRVLSI